MEETFGEVSKKLNLFEKVFYSLAHPGELFKTVRKEPFSSSFLYLLFILAVPILISLLFDILGITIIYSIPINLAVSLSVLIYLLIYALEIIGVFVIVGIYHIFAKLFGGVSGYEETFKAYVYGLTPAALMGWIPFLNLLAFIYSIYLFIKGVSILHGLSTGKSILVVFIPILIIVVIVLLFFGALIATYLAAISMKNYPELLNQTGEIVKVLKKI